MELALAPKVECETEHVWEESIAVRKWVHIEPGVSPHFSSKLFTRFDLFLLKLVVLYYFARYGIPLLCLRGPFDCHLAVPASHLLS